MNHHFDCPTFSGNPLIKPLVFDWDDEAGTVSGPGAEDILRWAAAGGVPMHPMPAGHTFSAEPLKSRTDLAAIIGLLHRLPPELQDAYPLLDEGGGGEDPDYEFGGPVASDDPALFDPTPIEVIY
jgi:hypothetical protein